MSFECAELCAPIGFAQTVAIKWERGERTKARKSSKTLSPRIVDDVYVSQSKYVVNSSSHFIEDESGKKENNTPTRTRFQGLQVQTLVNNTSSESEL
jgi:hypothetical protein